MPAQWSRSKWSSPRPVDWADERYRDLAQARVPEPPPAPPPAPECRWHAEYSDGHHWYFRAHRGCEVERVRDFGRKLGAEPLYVVEVF